MKNDEKELFKKFKEVSASYNFIKEDISTLKCKEKRRGYFMKKKVIATACASLVLVSGIALAANIENIRNHFNRGLGDGIETAIDNGYIAKPEMEFVKLDNIDVKVKIEDFIMDDVNLSTNFKFEFGENIINEINMENVNEIVLNDLIVRDEKNRIVYSNTNQETFEKYCNENNLNYKFGEFNENYMNNGLEGFIISKEENTVDLMYNMYTNSAFPKSKKLYYSFETILLKETISEKEINYEVNGAWNTVVDVPKEMYNRTEEYYKVVSCDEEDFKVYTAKVTDTGFEIGLIISNIEEPEYDDNAFDEFIAANNAYNNKEISEEEFIKRCEKYVEYSYLNKPISISTEVFGIKQTTPSYVENKNGNKFECSFIASRKNKNYFIEGNNYDFFETFSMTKYDATDEIKVLLYYYGKPVTIELEKI